MGTTTTYYVGGHYELQGSTVRSKHVGRDFMAGLIVAMAAIPLAMGFAMASGLRPEQGIVGGALAGIVGALWRGSKYLAAVITSENLEEGLAMCEGQPDAYLFDDI